MRARQQAESEGRTAWLQIEADTNNTVGLGFVPVPPFAGLPAMCPREDGIGPVDRPPVSIRSSTAGARLQPVLARRSVAAYYLLGLLGQGVLNQPFAV